MQNENAGKTVEQIASNEEDIQWCKGYEKGFAKGIIYAQQSQPMWREIEMDREYEYVVVRTEMGSISQFDYAGGAFLAELGYTHYLSSDDLLKLPTEKK